jgi:hypothetical protein
MKTTFRNRGIGFVVGALTFVGAHLVEVEWWTRFGGEHAPWFLNSGSAAAFTVAILFIVALIGGAVSLNAWTNAAGAVTAMIVVLASQGGSNILPIVISGGGVLVGGACLLGAWIGKELDGLRRPRPHS